MDHSIILTRAMQKYQLELEISIQVELYGEFYDCDTVALPGYEMKLAYPRTTIPEGVCRFRRYYFHSDILCLICDPIPMEVMLKEHGPYVITNEVPIFSVAFSKKGEFYGEGFIFHTSSGFYELFTMVDTKRIPEPDEFGIYHELKPGALTKSCKRPA